jgi:hypothetical protein
MITLTREEAQQVLDALICSGPHGWSPNLVNQHNKILKTLRARLSAPEPEPVAYRVWGRMGGISFRHTKPDESEYVEWDELYLAPPQSEPPCKTGSQCIGGKCLQCVAREWQELTENEKELLWDEAVEGREHFCSQYGNFADALEAKLKEKNT